jgi:hypothetical protein
VCQTDQRHVALRKRSCSCKWVLGRRGREDRRHVLQARSDGVQAHPFLKKHHGASLHSHVACRSSAPEDEANVIGFLGGRKLVQAGTVDSSAFYVKRVTKGTAMLQISALLRQIAF